jgi:hypothetical protein
MNTFYQMVYKLFTRKTALTLVFLLITRALFAQTDETALDKALAKLTDVRVVTKTVLYSPFKLQYQLKIKQPIDHTDPSKGYFYQQLQLIHRGFSKLMVMSTEGYDEWQGGNELEKIFNCNNLDIEFRYFNKSKPDPIQWQYCTFEQATADLHHINQVFRSLYNSKWISTGISRGGETTLTYRYFYPNDVDASVPYVAPMPTDIEDKRIYAFLDTAGGPVVAAKIKAVQVFMLQHEKEALALQPLSAQKLHYRALGGIGAAYEIGIMEYPFSFWQVTDIDPKDIPDNGNFNDYYKHVMQVLGGDVSQFADENGVEPMLPHLYMTYQTGYYSYNIQPFKPYLHYLSGANPSSAFLPPELPRKAYDPEFNRKINAWLTKSGNNILYIYGGRDTWSACKAELGSDVKAKLFMVPGANHYMARIKNMPPPMQQEFVTLLEQMTGLKADLALLK